MIHNFHKWKYISKTTRFWSVQCIALSNQTMPCNAPCKNFFGINISGAFHADASYPEFINKLSILASSHAVGHNCCDVHGRYPPISKPECTVIIKFYDCLGLRWNSLLIFMQCETFLMFISKSGNHITCFIRKLHKDVKERVLCTYWAIPDNIRPPL